MISCLIYQVSQINPCLVKVAGEDRSATNGK